MKILNSKEYLDNQDIFDKQKIDKCMDRIHDIFDKQKVDKCMAVLQVT